MDVTNSSTIGGSLQISTDVIAKIAKLATLEIEGVKEVSTGTMGVKSLFNKVNLQKPILVQLTDDVAEITGDIMVKDGYKSPERWEKVQENGKSSVQNMTCVTVSKVNIGVTGVAQESACMEGEQPRKSMTLPLSAGGFVFVRNIMKRRIARENAFIAAFEASFNANSIEEIVAASREQDEYAVDAYGEALLANFYAHSAEVDDLIKARLKDWTLARLPRVNAAILRLAVTEMRFNGSDDMDSIVINEAVELAKKYAGEEDYQFINGVLGAISREAHSAKADEPAVPADSASEEA